MTRDALWLGVVLLLGGSLLVLLMPENEPASVEDEVAEELEHEETCIVGTQKVLNASSATGFDCVPLDPHSLAHNHPAPVLTVSDVVDDGSVIVILGHVDHLHPDEITITMTFEGDLSLSTQANLQGDWSLRAESDVQEDIQLTIVATHPVEATASNTTVVDIDRTPEQTDASDADGGEGETNSGVGDPADRTARRHHLRRLGHGSVLA